MQCANSHVKEQAKYGIARSSQVQAPSRNLLATVNKIKIFKHLIFDMFLIKYKNNFNSKRMAFHV